MFVAVQRGRRGAVAVALPDRFTRGDRGLEVADALTLESCESSVEGSRAAVDLGKEDIAGAFLGRNALGLPQPVEIQATGCAGQDRDVGLLEGGVDALPIAGGGVDEGEVSAGSSAA